MTSYLSRDTILQREDIVTEDVPVPEWGGTVRVRGMSGVERDKFESSLILDPDAGNPKPSVRRRRQAEREVNMANIRAKMVAWCCIDGDGNRLFWEEDIPALGKKSAAALDRIFEVAQRLSGITEEDVDEIAQEMVERPFDETS